jgi:hypothetical protein
MALVEELIPPRSKRMVLVRAPRHPADIQILYEVGESDFAGRISNISRSGAYVEVDFFVPYVGRRIRLLMSGPRDRRVDVDACVVRVTPRGYGAQFLGKPIELLELLADLGNKTGEVQRA